MKSILIYLKSHFPRILRYDYLYITNSLIYKNLVGHNEIFIGLIKTINNLLLSYINYPETITISDSNEVVNFYILLSKIKYNDPFINELIKITDVCLKEKKHNKLSTFIDLFIGLYYSYLDNDERIETLREIKGIVFKNSSIVNYFKDRSYGFKTLELVYHNYFAIKNFDYDIYADNSKVKKRRQTYLSDLSGRMFEIIFKQLKNSYHVFCNTLNSKKYSETSFIDIAKFSPKDYDNVKFILQRKIYFSNKKRNIFYISEYEKFKQRVREVAHEYDYFIVINIPYIFQLLVFNTDTQSELVGYAERLAKLCLIQNQTIHNHPIYLHLLNLVLIRSFIKNNIRLCENVINYEEEFLIFSHDVNDLIVNLNDFLFYFLGGYYPNIKTFNTSIFKHLEFVSKIDNKNLKIYDISINFDPFERIELLKKWSNFYEGCLIDNELIMEKRTLSKKIIDSISQMFVNVFTTPPINDELKNSYNKSLSTDFLNNKIKRRRQYDIKPSDKFEKDKKLKEIKKLKEVKKNYEEKEIDDDDLLVLCPNCLEPSDCVLFCQHCYCKSCANDMTYCYMCDQMAIILGPIYQ